MRPTLLFFLLPLITAAQITTYPNASSSGNATTVNGGSVPASQPCVGTNSSSQFIAGTCGTPTLTNTHFFVGNGSNIVTDVVMSKDATLANTGAVTVIGLNGTLLTGLGTGILKNTTATGVPSIALVADVISLFAGTCNASTLLGGDGFCKTVSSGFDTITSGTNATAAMVLGTGSSLTVSGSGTNNATSLGGNAAALYALLASPALTTPTITTSAIINNNGIGSTSTDGLRLSNTTGSLTGQQQFSPRLRLFGTGWGTTAGTSQTSEIILENASIRDTTVDPNLRISYIENGGTQTTLFQIAPQVTFHSQPLFYFGQTPSATNYNMSGDGTNTVVNAGAGGISFRINNNTVAVSNGNGGVCPGGTTDTCIWRNASGVLEVNQDVTGRFGDLRARHLLSGSVATFAPAPTITSGFGTSPAIAGGDEVFVVTVGTGGLATTGTVTFGTAYTNAPVCTANDDSTILAVQPNTTTTTVSITVATPFGASDKIGVLCRGY